MKVRNTFIIFIVSGFWHGANWTFIVWGALNALYILPLVLTNKNQNYLEIVAHGKTLPTLKELYSMLMTFCLTSFAIIIFRANNIEHALIYISTIFSRSFFTIPSLGLTSLNGITTIALVIIFVAVEWIGREHQYAIAHLGANWYRPIRWVAYSIIILVCLFFGGQQQQFVYFQF